MAATPETGTVDPVSDWRVRPSKPDKGLEPATAVLSKPTAAVPAVIDLAPLLGVLVVVGRSPLAPHGKPLAFVLAAVMLVAPMIRRLPFVARFALALAATIANLALGTSVKEFGRSSFSMLHKVTKAGTRAQRIAVALVMATLSLPLVLHADVTVLSNHHATSSVVGDDLIRMAVVVFALRLLRRTAQQEARLETAAAEAVTAERARIARELHDVVAHHVSVVVVQAQAGQAVLPAEPERASRALHDIEVSARQAMVELRRVLGVLRTDADAPLAPQPTLAALQELAAQIEPAGVAVTVHIEGAETALPSGVGLSVYRIVQEALTNVVRHAHATRADVVVAYGPRGLDVTVSDDGRGDQRAAGHGDGTGHGLAGMRERVSMLGGTIEAGEGDAGGFCVRAHIPLAADDAAAPVRNTR